MTKHLIANRAEHVALIFISINRSMQLHLLAATPRISRAFVWQNSGIVPSGNRIVSIVESVALKHSKLYVFIAINTGIWSLPRCIATQKLFDDDCRKFLCVIPHIKIYSELLSDPLSVNSILRITTAPNRASRHV
ncbi:Uncharacterised protein [Chlamydia trachomatis]|nr:Uncharacterised protein [Chlamydia trachomatis]